MKKEYSIPELFLITFKAEDVFTITTSGDTNIDLDDPEEFSLRQN